MFSGSDTTSKLDRVVPLDEILKADQVEDCVLCKLTGATAFFGLGAYSYFSGHAQLRAQEATILKSASRFGMKSRQAGITTIALSLAGLGFWRLVN
ncbi:hypothetical protein K3495_g2118 [Podosphaera aphanis]|nr:hypothetical protein K3495_g2118 [Podosphaera aphanis]